MAISEDLFDCWRAGDKEARNIIWGILFEKFHKTITYQMGGDKGSATDVINDTFKEIDRKKNDKNADGKDFITWEGEASFYAFFKNRLQLRIQTKLQQEQIEIIVHGETRRVRRVISILELIKGDEEKEESDIVDDIISKSLPDELPEECFEDFHKIVERLFDAEKETLLAIGQVIVEFEFMYERGEKKSEIPKSHELTEMLQKLLDLPMSTISPRLTRIRKAFEPFMKKYFGGWYEQENLEKLEKKREEKPIRFFSIFMSYILSDQEQEKVPLINPFLAMALEEALPIKFLKDFDNIRKGLHSDQLDFVLKSLKVISEFERKRGKDKKSEVEHSGEDSVIVNDLESEHGKSKRVKKMLSSRELTAKLAKLLCLSEEDIRVLKSKVRETFKPTTELWIKTRDEELEKLNIEKERKEKSKKKTRDPKGNE